MYTPRVILKKTQIQKKLKQVVPAAPPPLRRQNAVAPSEYIVQPQSKL